MCSCNVGAVWWVRADPLPREQGGNEVKRAASKGEMARVSHLVHTTHQKNPAGPRKTARPCFDQVHRLDCEKVIFVYPLVYFNGCFAP